MGWKIFAVVMVVVFAVGLLDSDSNWDAINLLSVPISAVATIGLFAYAFGITRLQTRYWMPFSWFLAGWSVLTLTVGAVRASSTPSPIWAMIGANLIGAALYYYRWLAVYRLARFPRPSPQDGSVG